MAKKKAFQPYWRPDFRNPSTLPDIKVIRTDFLINGFAMACAISALFFFLQKEYRARSLETLVSGLREQVALLTPQNAKSLQLNERFRTAGLYVAEIQSFHNSPYSPDELLVDLSNSVPDGLVFRQISMNEAIYNIAKTPYLGISISLAGSVRDLTILENYLTLLRNADFLNPEGFSAEVEESVSAPDAVTRIFPFQLTIEVKPVLPKKGGK